MRKDEVDVLVALRGAAEDQAGDRAGGICAEFDRRLGQALDQIDAAIGSGRVGVYRRLAPIQFFPDRGELRIAQPICRRSSSSCRCHRPSGRRTCIRSPSGSLRYDALGIFVLRILYRSQNEWVILVRGCNGEAAIWHAGMRAI
jgi:hypothetical protein